MRSAHVLACTWVSLACASAFLACAASGDETNPVREPESDGGQTAVPDGGAPERDAETEGAAPESTCSNAGWCVTALPDPDLVMRDIWPVGERAFAIAESSTLGVKVLEWNESEQTWAYIDDGSQHEFTSVSYVGKVWAPNEDEVYYGGAPGYIFHGSRPIAPATTWSWTRHELEDRSHPDRGVNLEDGYPYDRSPYDRSPFRAPALGVWGTSANDVYAWFTNSIYHWKSVDGGAPGWVLEYVANDPAAPDGRHDFDEHLYFTGAAGTNPDDVWFTGARARSSYGCALVVRKTGGEYRRIADGVLSKDTLSCAERAGAIFLGERGWLADIQAVAPGQFIGLKGGIDALRISVDGDGYSVDISNLDSSLTFLGPVTSLWATGRDAWLSGRGGFVLRGNDVWDGGSYSLSRVSQPSGPLDRRLYKIRGTSNSNIWAIGEGYALHKTTP